MKEFPKLFIPGPTYVSKKVLDALSTPQIGHRTPELSLLFKEIHDGVQEILYTKNRVYLVSHAATGLWEAGLLNACTKGVLHTVNGAFSSKWALVSEKYGYKFDALNYEWGQGSRSEDIDKKLSSGKFDVLAMVHNETSTGVKSDLLSVSKLLKEKYPDVIWLLDAVSSMAGIKIEVDKLGIDFLLSSTQKAWGLPAGFSVCSVSDKLLERSKEIKNKGYFFDFEVYEKYRLKNQTPTTPSLPHMFGLSKVINMIKKEGLDLRWNRHLQMSQYTREWALNHGQILFPDKGCESETITCIRNKMKWDINKINNKLLSKGFRMDRGYGKLRGEAFRIPHMGNVHMEDLEEYLNVFDEVLKDV